MIFEIFRKDIHRKTKDLLTINRKKKFYEYVASKKRMEKQFCNLDADEQILKKWGLNQEAKNLESLKK